MRPYERYDTLKQFLDNDRKVLRFYGIWDDTNNMFGEVREMVLHYHLADDTVELLEVYKANCQRDTIPIYLHRVQLPKVHTRIHDMYCIQLTAGAPCNVTLSRGVRGKWGVV